jgi:hypothetical protein
MRTAMKTCLAILIGDENCLVKTAQVLTGHMKKKTQILKKMKNKKS